MRTLLPTTALLALAFAGTAEAAPSRDPSGVWLTADGRARVRVEKCGTKATNLCGTVVWLKSPMTDEGKPRTDIKNPDPAKRTRPVIGMPLMSGLTPEDGKFKGEIYNAEEGRNYKVWVGLEGGELNVEGCVLGVLCGSQNWTRVTDPGALASADAIVTGSTGARPAAKPAAPKPAAPAVPAPAQAPSEDED